LVQAELICASQSVSTVATVALELKLIVKDHGKVDGNTPAALHR
jgi:hypothetical protein